MASMESADWRMVEKTIIYDPIEELAKGLSPEEKANLELVITELQGWDTQDVDKVLSVMAPDCVYYDVTGDPAIGHEGLREFGDGWTGAVPDFTIFVESFVVEGNKVADLGRIEGTIKGEFFGNPATGKKFSCQYFQYCLIENGKIKYVRDHWNAACMYNQVGWDLMTLKV